MTVTNKVTQSLLTFFFYFYNFQSMLCGKAQVEKRRKIGGYFGQVKSAQGIAQK